jgi:hypothetical protein
MKQLEFIVLAIASYVWRLFLPSAVRHVLVVVLSMGRLGLLFADNTQGIFGEKGELG